MTKNQSQEHEISRLNSVIAELNRKLDILKHSDMKDAIALFRSMRLGEDNIELNSTKTSTTFGSQEEHRLLAAAAGASENPPPFIFNRSKWGGGNPLNQSVANSSQNELVSTESDASASSAPSRNLLQKSATYQEPERPQLRRHGSSSDFGNLAFSSSIGANHYPPEIQKQQIENLFEPRWAILPLNTQTGDPSVKESVAATIREARLQIQSGQSVEAIVGKHCNIAAIYDHGQYRRSTLLCQWAAGLVFSLLHKNHHFVAYAAMQLTWSLARWLVDPRPDTYEALPEWYRPTTDQLFRPHVEIIDFVVWPALRDRLVNDEALQEDLRWLNILSKTINCDWFLAPEMALEIEPAFGVVQLTDSAKMVTEQLENWSAGPALLQCIENANTLVRIDTSGQLQPDGF
ncbi:hypothetical protein BX600DRAFT_508578 [Xylariales sp. PMI_506]|nr:hypothetical protein BX600DRAFT_508578 [Xylariales sp. PMI_506]